MLCLKARFEEQTLRFPLPEGRVELGSAPGSGILLPYPGVSRLHAVVEPVRGGVALRDAGSRNGLFFEGKRCREAVLAPGGEVGIGKAFLSLEEADASDVELALVVEAAGGPAGRDAVETGSASEARIARDAAGALRLVRECEAARDAGGVEPFPVLARAAAILGAAGLTLWERTGDGVLAIVATWGGHGVEEPGTGERSIVWSTASRAGGAKARDAGLTARFGPDVETAEPWRVDLVAYLGHVLTGPVARQAGTVPSRAEGAPLHLPPGMIAGSSPAMRELLTQVQAAAGSGIDVLLTGETGTGKELVARAIHASGRGRTGSMVTVNCAAIPAELLEADLFGVQGRVATGVDPRPGRLLQAEGGTVFLDEVGELAPPLQAKLLRFLQEREVQAVGASAPRRVDVRVVAATNRDLGEEVRRGSFRADLYYRLRGLELRVPPLRERREDIPELALAFVSRAATASEKEVRGITRKALAALVAHDWPGNVRELDADMRRAVLLCPHGGSIGTPQLAAGVLGSGEAPRPSLDPRERLAGEERRILERALDEAGGNRAEAARRLGLKRTTFLMRLRRGGPSIRHDE